MLPKKETNKNKTSAILAIVENVRDLETDKQLYMDRGKEAVCIWRKDLEVGKKLVMVRYGGNRDESITPIVSVIEVDNTITVYTEDTVFTLRIKMG